MKQKCVNCEKCCEVIGIGDRYHGYFCDFSDTTFIELIKSRPFQFNKCKHFKEKEHETNNKNKN